MLDLPPGIGQLSTPQRGSRDRRCSECDNKGELPSRIYYRGLGYSDMTFCTCPLGQSKFQAWRDGPHQRDYARSLHESAVARLFEASELPPKFQDSSLEDLHAHPEVQTRCEDYVSRWPSHQATGKGLYLFGRVGAGKSTVASIVASSLIRKYLVPTLHVSLPEVAQMLAEGPGQSRWPAMRNVELLVLEDIDRVACSNLLFGHLYRLINHRWQEGKPMILTASCDLRQFAGLHSAPIISRIRASCEPLKVPGYDRRTLQ